MNTKDESKDIDLRTSYDLYEYIKKKSPESQCHFALMHRPFEQLNWVRGSQVGKAEKV